MTPPPQPGRRIVLGLIGVAAAAAGVLLATDEGFRKEVVDSAKALGAEIRTPSQLVGPVA